MRTALAAMLATAAFVLPLQSVSAQSDTTQEGTTVYPNTSAKDYSFDAPWRVRSTSAPIPFLLEIKDADANNMSSLKTCEYSYVKGDGGEVLFHYHDFGGITISDGYYSYLMEMTASQIDSYVPEAIQPGDTITVKCDMTYVDYPWPFNQHFIKYLKIQVGRPLPNIDGDWYYGDTHFHTNFTDNIYEYGGSIEMAALCGKAMGIHWTSTNDHSENGSCYAEAPGTPDGFPLVIGDLEENEWGELGTQCTSNSDNTFVIIRGQEITCDEDGSTPSDKESIHLLSYGNSSYVPGPVSWNNSYNCPSGTVQLIRPLSDILDDIGASGGIAYAAHPMDEGYPPFYLNIVPWSNTNYQTALTRGHFRGLEIWNGKTTDNKNINYEDCNPFPWGYNPSWDGELGDGLAKWDELLISRLNIPAQRRFFMLGGSDAHGDYNYTVTGPIDIKANNNAFGKVRTAAYCPNGMGSGGSAVLEAMREGHTVVTDGPLVVFGIDTDGDGQLEQSDHLIGSEGTLNVAGTANLIVQWESSLDFGRIRELKVLVGHPSLGGGVKTSTLYSNTSINSYSGSISTQVGNLLQSKGISGWCYLRAEGYTADGLFRCHTNPIWLNLYENIPPEVISVTSLYLSPSTVDPYGLFDVAGTAQYGDGSLVSVGTAAITIQGGNTYTAPVVNGTFLRGDCQAPGNTGTSNIYRTVTATVSDGVATPGQASTTLTIRGQGGVSYNLITDIVYDWDGDDYSVTWWWKDAFRTTDPGAWLMAVFENVSTSQYHDIQWRLYYPWGDQYGSHTIVDALWPPGGWWWYTWGWYISGNSMSYYPGRYRMEFFVDGDRKTTHHYVVAWDFTQHTMCRDILEWYNGGQFLPLDETNVFAPGDTWVIAWHQFEYVAQDVPVRVTFVKPDGGTYVTREHTLSTSGLGPNDWYGWYRYQASFGLNGSDAMYLCGDWRVDFYVRNPTTSTWEQKYTDHFRIEESELPSVTTSREPNTPVAGESIQISVSATDNNHLDRVVLHWNDGQDHTRELGNHVNSSSFTRTENIGTFAAGQHVVYWAEVWDESGNRTESGHASFDVGACECPLQSDYDEDGYLTMLDLAIQIDVVYGGWPDVQDGSCNVPRGDFDCDGFSTALDVSSLVDHLFAGWSGPCDPCDLPNSLMTKSVEAVQ